ncbi:glycosyltransferase family 2 protein [Luteimonas sp. MC1750]|uniref:glycosyltransferase family 2 protein n=1 Tax=Luteimonas sp. MC1750 TaxID=2799326 RepID=UPI0018F0F5A1|nr:glycosyltransferase family 2 protein [Luteimonas sp. MC1750]MBJ6985030.1 glycosyltransferase family 2 protein [Luteimonas sp. MC1750]QQO05698.1 glycosyltransferase family 2 protein [Luteimonas sp. MC1750]
MERKPEASVIFTTYNQPEWLEKVLHGFAAQDRDDFEVLVADDGSDAHTRERLQALIPRLPMPVRHLWQPDEGFRKCEALNKAIAAARADYLVFTDGDCIPRADFLSTHLRERERGRFLSGGYHKLPMATSRAISEEDVRSQRCFDASWLHAEGMPRSHRDRKLTAGPGMARLLDLVSPARASWNGHNASAWRRDVLAVNGFDQRMRYGGEDREFGERLANAGIRGKRIRHRAIVVHLDHPRGYVTAEGVAFNRALREETRRTRRTWTGCGIDAGPAPDVRPVATIGQASRA